VFCFEQIQISTQQNLKNTGGLLELIKIITFHTARHNFHTPFYKVCNSTKKVLGHKKIATTQAYGHILDNTQKKN
jgi:site-specific recombinase XerD